MSKTKIILDKEYFTAKTTDNFLRDLEKACRRMDLDDFTTLFEEYDLTFIEDYDEVLEMITDQLSRPNKIKWGTVILAVTKFDSKCLFCEIGKTVKVYKYTYQHKRWRVPLNDSIFTGSIAFYFSFENKRLTEFGVCNNYLDKEEIDQINAH